MTKELSKQICEKCGIKPRYGLYINVGDLDANYELVTNERKYRLIADYRYEVDEEEQLRNLKAVYYPDFGQPENFVKLLELTFEPSQSTIWNLVNVQGRHFSKHRTYCRLTFLALLNVVLENNPKMLSDEQNELIKQSIREAEWKYE